MINHREVARRLAVTMHAYTFINSGEVVQHSIRLCDIVFEKMHHLANLFCRNPGRGNVITGRFSNQRHTGKLFLQLINDIGIKHWQW